LLVNDDGSPIRIDHSFSWEAPLGLHGMMHAVIGNAAKGDPYKIDVLFMFMANMAWNSAMNPLETIECLTAKDASGEYVIPTVIYSDAFFSETVPYADLILPDTTYLERWDCISSCGSSDWVFSWARRCHSPARAEAGSRCAALPGCAD
jgi:anaerobic selenocysteine-containing dehydrogenase